MKKLCSLLIVLSGFSTLLSAKTTGTGIPNMFPHMGSDGGNNLPTATYSRLIGMVFLKHDGSAYVPVDSTTYSYSFGRGGQLSRDNMDDNAVLFDDSYTYLYVPSTHTYRYQYHRFQAFNAAGKPIRYTCRSWQPVLGAWRDSARYVYQYNNDLTKLQQTNFEIFYAGVWAQHVTYRSSYDSKGNLLKMQSTAFSMTFDYDANSNMLTRTDSSVNISPFYWFAKQKYVYSYDVANRLIAYVVQELENGIWTDKQKFEYAYLGSAVSEIAHYNRVNNSWELQGKHVLSYDAANNLSVDEWQYWDAAGAKFRSVKRTLWTFNVFNQPTSYFSQTFDPSTVSWQVTNGDFLYRYYYQSFIPASVSAISNQPGLLLYPQPASDVLHVSLNNMGAACELSVCDMQGRTVMQLPAATSSRCQLDVSRFFSGTYFLRAKSINGEAVQLFLVVR